MHPTAFAPVELSHQFYSYLSRSFFKIHFDRVAVLGVEVVNVYGESVLNGRTA